MYKRYEFGDRAVSAFNIPPAVNEGMRNSPLSDISGMHVYLSSRPDAEGYARAVREASDDEIELARPQLYFVLGELKERMFVHSVHADLYFTKEPTPQALLGSVIDGVSADAGKLLVECDRNPRSKVHARRLAGVHAYLADIEAVAGAVAAADREAFGDMAEKASGEFSRFAAAVEALKKATEAHYPVIAETVPSAEEARSTAAAALAADDFSVPRLSSDRIERLLAACGSRDVLWSVSSGVARREKYIEKGWYRPLSKADTDELREGVAGILEEYDSVFNRPGLLAELKQVAASLRWRGLSDVDMAESLNEASVRRRKQSRYERDEEYRNGIEAEVARIPKDKESRRSQARKALSQSSMISGFIADAGRSVRPEIRADFIDFSVRDGAMVGAFGDQAIVIWDDHIVRQGAGHPDRTVRAAAVYAAKVPLSELEDGVPSLEEVRERMFSKATNYLSAEECLGELDGEIESGFFFDGSRISGHNGFDVLPEWKAELEAGSSAGLKP